MADWVVLTTFVAVGFILAVAVFGYVVRSRRNPLTLLKAVGGGGAGAAAIAAAGTKIGGLAVALTWAEAAMVTTLSFIASLVVVTISALLIFWWLIVRPIKKRFGRHQSVRVWTEFWAGVEPLKDWITRTIRDVQADNSWDEFACAFAHVQHDLKSMAEGMDYADMFVSNSPQEYLGMDRDEAAINAIRAIIEAPIETLTARLTHTTFNFSIWRVHEHKDQLEHLLSLPVDHGHEAGHGHKPALPIWKKLLWKSSSGSLAAEAMMSGVYQSVRQSDLKLRWPRRQLGKKYDAVGAMPIPCDGGEESIWGVICVESRDGTIPLESHAVRLLLGELSRTINATRAHVARRTIDDTRQVKGTRNQAKKTAVAKPLQPTVPLDPTAVANSTLKTSVTHGTHGASVVPLENIEREVKPSRPETPVGQTIEQQNGG